MTTPNYTCWGTSELIERIHELEAQQKRTQNAESGHTVAALDDIASTIDWDNYQETDEDGEPTGAWSVPQVLYCKTQEVLQQLGDSKENEEAADLLAQCADLLEALQADGIKESTEN